MTEPPSSQSRPDSHARPRGERGSLFRQPRTRVGAACLAVGLVVGVGFALNNWFGSAGDDEDPAGAPALTANASPNHGGPGIHEQDPNATSNPRPQPLPPNRDSP